MFYWLLPNIAMFAARLTSRGRVNHQLRQSLVAWPHDVVQIEKPVVGVIIDAIHTGSLQLCRLLIKSEIATNDCTDYHVNLMPKGNEKLNGCSVR